MAKINVNLDDVKELQAVPAGNYLCTVQEGEVKDGPKAQYIKWVLCIADGEHTGQLLFNNTSLSPDAQFGLKGFLEACKFEWGKTSFNTEDVCGCEVIAKVVADIYQGEVKSKVKGFMSVE